MPASELFETNLALLKRWMPAFDLHVQTHIEICDANEKSVQEWFASLSLEGVQVLYVYGVGKGEYFLPLREWLEDDEERYVVFLESDLKILSELLYCKLATAMLSHPRVQVHHLEHEDFASPILDWLIDFFQAMPAQISAISPYRVQYAGFYQRLHETLMHRSYTAHVMRAEHADHGCLFYRNFYRNLKHLPRACHGNQLFGKFSGVPAIICGAGPSLQQNIHQLHGLADRALIFAAGSALSALSTASIQPQLGVGIDPTALHHQRTLAHQAFSIPLFYRSRMHYDAVEAHHGPRLYINGAGGSYTLPEWIEEELQISHDIIDEGYSVATFALGIAYAMGCYPIIFVGMDLAFSEDKLYAAGILKEELSLPKDRGGKGFERPILMKDVFGKDIYTLSKWVCEADWISNFAQQHSQCTLINATEGGIGFSNVPNMSLSQVTQRYLQRSYDLKGRLSCIVHQSQLTQVTREKVDARMNEIKASLERCVEWGRQLTQEWQRYAQCLAHLTEPPEMIGTGLTALLETELEEELAYRHVLAPLVAFDAHVQFRRTFRGWEEVDEEQKLKKLINDIHLKQHKYRCVQQSAEAQLQLMRVK
jgi:hypothetical protein